MKLQLAELVLERLERWRVLGPGVDLDMLATGLLVVEDEVRGLGRLEPATYVAATARRWRDGRPVKTWLAYAEPVRAAEPLTERLENELSRASMSMLDLLFLECLAQWDVDCVRVAFWRNSRPGVRREQVGVGVSVVRHGVVEERVEWAGDPVAIQRQPLLAMYGIRSGLGALLDPDRAARYSPEGEGAIP